MLVVRGTKKLRDRLGRAAIAEPGDASTTVLGDWFATALFWRPQVAMLVNQRTLLPVFLPLAPAATLVDRIPGAIANALRQQGVDESVVVAELAAMETVRIAPTNDRSVLGVMNEFVFQAGWHHDEGLDDLDALSYRLSSRLVGPLLGRHGSPDRELAALLGTTSSNVIPFPRQGAATSATAPVAPRGIAAVGDVFQLKVMLRRVRPPVWRRVLVGSTATLDELHQVVQAAFGWWNYHLYEFEIGRRRYGVPDPEWDLGPPPRPARRTLLHNVAKAGDTFVYTYDFGDGWEHEIAVEKVLPGSPDLDLPACIDGRRACPPEDCGGPSGYEELLHILRDPAHPEHEERVLWAEEWGGGAFDPEAFDPADFATNLTTLHLSAPE